MKKKEKKLKLEKVTIVNVVQLLTEEEKKRINGGFEAEPGTTRIRIFC